MKSNKTLIGTGVLTAIASSLCCITPLIALFAGTSSLATTFTNLESYRPYFIGFTIFLLGFAWYQKLKPIKKNDCNCEVVEKKTFLQSKAFLGIMTVFAILLLAFPYYSYQFLPKTKTNSIVTKNAKIQKTEFTIEGMTCKSCEQIVDSEINKLSGILDTEISFENKKAIISFDSSVTSLKEVKDAILATGYTIKK